MEATAASGNSTEDSQASRPKRALPRFDYNVLNGTSGNLNAMLHAAGQTMSHIAECEVAEPVQESLKCAC